MHWSRLPQCALDPSPSSTKEYYKDCGKEDLLEETVVTIAEPLASAGLLQNTLSL